MRRAAAILAAAALLGWSCFAAQCAPVVEVLDYQDLEGWESDDLQAGLDTFLNTCGDLKEPDWAAVCKVAKSNPDPRWFFETLFRPVRIDDGALSLVTGYFEPEIPGSRRRSARYTIPVYAKPPELTEGTLWYDRATIETGTIMQDRGLELAWVADRAALFYMQVQGSGRIRLTDGSVLRLGYAASNGHVFRSPGEMLVEQGIYDQHQVSATVVGNWVRRNPEDGAKLLRGSPSYVFFREIRNAAPGDGPRGAMNRPLTSGRTLAVDPAFVKLGAPVWIEKGGEDTVRRLMVAQDTGSAIKGAQRADFFVGTGADAGRTAQKMRDPGRLYVLLPIDRAYALAAGQT